MPTDTHAQPASEYVSDVPYDRTFVHQLTPSGLRLAAALNGVTPPPEDDFDYLDLGSGPGDTLVGLAAANPRARFVGVDISPEYVAFANELARKGGVTNVRFLERDFEALDHEELPPFDFVATHGVFSWISPAKRAALLELSKNKLKRGGLFYVGYNALPGWSAIEPLRRLMLDFSANVEGSTLDRARAGFGLVQRLAEAGASYVSSHTTAKQMLALMQQAGLPYVVHEYFHAYWNPMYFADVAREMTAHDLEFVGQLPLALNVRELALPPALKEIAKPAPDRIAYETMKDFALNEMFRSDIFVRGGAPPAETAKRAYFEGTPFGTTTTLEQIRRNVKLPVYTLDYTGPVYEAILGEIDAGAASATELAARPKTAQLGVTRIGDCLQNLALGGQVVPMRPATPGASKEGRYRVPLAYNRFVLEDVLTGGGSPRALMSPTSGASLPVTLLDMLCLHLLTAVEQPARGSWLRKFSHQKTPRLTLGDRTITDGDDLVRTVTRHIDVLVAKGLPKLVELGIAEPA